MEYLKWCILEYVKGNKGNKRLQSTINIVWRGIFIQDQLNW